jgi:subtilisin family serine protease
MRMRRRYRVQQALRLVPACHEEHISLVGPPNAIRELNRLIETSPDLPQEMGIPDLRPEPVEMSLPVYAYINGKWRSQVAQSQAETTLLLQLYAYTSDITPSDATAKLKDFLERQRPELLREITVCIDPVVDSPFDAGDAPFDAGDAPFDAGDAPFDAGDAPFDAGDAPFDAGDAPFDAGDAPLAVDPASVGNTIAGQPSLERIGFNWLRQERPDLTGADVTVLILDTLPVAGEMDVAHEYVDFWIDLVGDQSPPVEPPAEPPSPPRIPMAEIHKYHGVMVASLVRHLAPESTVVAARVLDDQGKGWSTTLIQAILWALSHRKNRTTINGRRLIHDKLIFNMSMGLPRTQAEEAEAICLLRTLDAAARAATLAVSAAGNDSWRKPENPVEPAAFGFFADTPATAAQVIAVAGTDRPAEYAFFSNEGHLAAPCRQIVGDTGTNSKIQQTYGFSTVRWSGTSFATPQVTGLAALLWSAGRVPFHQIKQHMWRTSQLPRRWHGVREIDCLRAFRAI